MIHGGAARRDRLLAGVVVSLLTLALPAPAGAAVDVVLSPGDDFQAAVDANPPGTSFLIESGVHRFQSVVPKDNMIFVGEPNAVMTGGRELTGWTFDGQRWWVGGQTQEGPVFGECEFGWERCNRAEDLFVNDVPLRHATSLNGVGPGLWFFDYGSDRIYIGEDPSGQVVETSVTAHAFAGDADGVVIRDLIVEKYASPAQTGAIWSETVGTVGSNWLVDSVESRLNHGSGVKLTNGGTVRRSHLHHNGQQGVNTSGPNVLVEDNEVAWNNFAHFELDWEGGGSKFALADNSIIRRNWAHDNYGPGLWVDVHAVVVSVESNVVEGNYRSGIFFEVSSDGQIAGNFAEANGVDDPRSGWYWGAGILVAAARNVAVFENTVVNNGNGITAVQQRRGSGPWGQLCVENLDVHDNHVTMDRGKSGAAQDYDPPSSGDCDLDIFDFATANNRFEANQYSLDGVNAARFGWEDIIQGFPAWMAYGHDDAGAVDTLDSVAPFWSAPNLTVTAATETSMTLEWSGAEDAGGVAAYRIYEASEGQIAATAGATNVTLTRLIPGSPLDITVQAVDTGGNESTDGPTLTTAVGDTTPPEIVLNPPNPLTLEAGVDSYVEPGAVVTDDLDASPVLVIDESGVDGSTPGSYQVVYTATDAAGNSSQVVRTVNVEDTTPPGVALIGDDPLVVPLGGPLVDPGANVTDNVDPPSVVFGTGVVDVATIGSYSLGYDATDAAGNVAFTVTRRVDVVHPAELRQRIVVEYDAVTGDFSLGYLVVKDDDPDFHGPGSEVGAPAEATINGMPFDAQGWFAGSSFDFTTTGGSVTGVEALHTTLNGWDFFVLESGVDPRNITGVTSFTAGSTTVVSSPYAGFDVVAGVTVGSAAADLMVLGAGGQVGVAGLGGDDWMDGWWGPDQMNGNGGNDFMVGGRGNDKLFGRGGSDTLHDGEGADKLTGNRGPDWFVLHPSDGVKDRILDYEDGVDKIVLPGWTFGDLTKVDRRPGRVLLKYGAERLLVKDTTGVLTAADLTPADFSFD